MSVISDIVDMGNAHERILNCGKEPARFDDDEPCSIPEEDAFDE